MLKCVKFVHLAIRGVNKCTEIKKGCLVGWFIDAPTEKKTTNKQTNSVEWCSMKVKEILFSFWLNV